MSLESQPLSSYLPPKLYRGLLMLTCSWVGERVSEGSLLINVHNVPSATKLPLIWCGGPIELPALIATCGQDRTIYGLRGTYEFARPTQDVITALSKYYVDEIQKNIPAQAYLIAGNCSAAYIAIEIAYVLHKRGCEIGFLGIIESEVTEKTLALKVARKIYIKFDRIGTLAIRFKRTLAGFIASQDKANYAKLIVDAISERLKKDWPYSRTLIRYQSNENDKMYQLKQYHAKINLFFVSWGVFGFYRFGFFQCYWRKVAPQGVTVDIIKGYSHENSPWMNILKALNKRILEAGF